MVGVKKVLVVGASGMLGHQVMRTLAPDFEVWGACRDPEILPDLGVPGSRILGDLDAMRPGMAEDLIERVRPDVVVNAVGIVKQQAVSKVAVPSIAVNSLWPHLLADACDAIDARLIHVSTDCVFTGDKGGYVETDVPDAFDLYGRSKLLGEVVDRENALTLRTSIVGWQLEGHTSLFGWFASHRDLPLKGYRRSVFSGLSTRLFAEVLRDVVFDRPDLSGLYHLSVEPIDKHTLLGKLADAMGWSVELTPDDTEVIDRSLDSSRFRSATGWTPPSWDAILADVAEDFVEPTV